MAWIPQLDGGYDQDEDYAVEGGEEETDLSSISSYSLSSSEDEDDLDAEDDGSGTRSRPRNSQRLQNGSKQIGNDNPKILTRRQRQHLKSGSGCIKRGRRQETNSVPERMDSEAQPKRKRGRPPKKDTSLKKDNPCSSGVRGRPPKSKVVEPPSQKRSPGVQPSGHSEIAGASSTCPKCRKLFENSEALKKHAYWCDSSRMTRSRRPGGSSSNLKRLQKTVVQNGKKSNGSTPAVLVKAKSSPTTASPSPRGRGRPAKKPKVEIQPQDFMVEDLKPADLSSSLENNVDELEEEAESPKVFENEEDQEVSMEQVELTEEADPVCPKCNMRYRNFVSLQKHLPTCSESSSEGEEEVVEEDLPPQQQHFVEEQPSEARLGCLPVEMGQMQPSQPEEQTFLTSSSPPPQLNYSHIPSPQPWAMGVSQSPAQIQEQINPTLFPAHRFPSQLTSSPVGREGHVQEVQIQRLQQPQVTSQQMSQFVPPNYSLTVATPQPVSSSVPQEIPIQRSFHSSPQMQQQHQLQPQLQRSVPPQTSQTLHQPQPHQEMTMVTLQDTVTGQLYRIPSFVQMPSFPQQQQHQHQLLDVPHQHQALPQAVQPSTSAATDQHSINVQQRSQITQLVHHQHQQSLNSHVLNPYFQQQQQINNVSQLQQQQQQQELNSLQFQIQHQQHGSQQGVVSSSILHQSPLVGGESYNSHNFHQLPSLQGMQRPALPPQQASAHYHGSSPLISQHHAFQHTNPYHVSSHRSVPMNPETSALLPPSAGTEQRQQIVQNIHQSLASHIPQGQSKSSGIFPPQQLNAQQQLQLASQSAFHQQQLQQQLLNAHQHQMQQALHLQQQNLAQKSSPGGAHGTTISQNLFPTPQPQLPPQLQLNQQSFQTISNNLHAMGAAPAIESKLQPQFTPQQGHMPSHQHILTPKLEQPFVPSPQQQQQHIYQQQYQQTSILESLQRQVQLSHGAAATQQQHSSQIMSQLNFQALQNDESHQRPVNPNPSLPPMTSFLQLQSGGIVLQGQGKVGQISAQQQRTPPKLYAAGSSPAGMEKYRKVLPLPPPRPIEPKPAPHSQVSSIESGKSFPASNVKSQLANMILEKQSIPQQFQSPPDSLQGVDTQNLRKNPILTAVVRPMEHPLQKMSHQISQLESTLNSPSNISNSSAAGSVVASETVPAELGPVPDPDQVHVSEPSLQQSSKESSPAPVPPVAAPLPPGPVIRAPSRPRRKSVNGKTTGSSPAKPIKLTLKRKERGDSYSVKDIYETGGSEAEFKFKNLKITARITSGELKGESTHVVVEPRIHFIPVPDPDCDELENLTIPEDGTESFVIPSIPVDYAEHGGTPKLAYRAVVVYEILRGSTVIFRSSNVRAIWCQIFEAAQGTRLNRNLPPLSYPATTVPLVKCFNMLGLTHRAIQFLLNHLPKKNKETPFKELPPKREDSSAEDLEDVISESGCARSEGYGGRKPFDMFGWLASKHRKPLEKMPPAGEENWKTTGMPLVQKYRKLKEREEMTLVVMWSIIHGRGLYTRRDIERGDMIIEYAGEVIRSVLCDQREKFYETKSIGCYMFRINDELVIDATMKGNAARFINHSCEPNCVSKTFKIDGIERILILALRKIVSGEELTYDYKFDKEDSKIPCACASRKCKKYLN